MADEFMQIDDAPTVSEIKQEPQNGQFDALSGPGLSQPSSRDNFKEIQVKVHIRKADKDSWQYLGRGIVTQDVSGHSSRVG
ncbi:hypothetical protein NLJ89_g7105 [Agrocybe chaxingu]|uniref:Uncharacterized protein n=1 Tax=Agrocybe chaxingu TaxID=84603 RepID=A0A9W8JXF9_9AGAR|nr:hypothetical protein NLJ89_g7105 [Agrocybe chaxingu]